MPLSHHIKALWSTSSCKEIYPVCSGRGWSGHRLASQVQGWEHRTRRDRWHRDHAPSWAEWCWPRSLQVPREARQSPRPLTPQQGPGKTPVCGPGSTGTAVIPALSLRQLRPELTPENPGHVYLQQLHLCSSPWAGMSNRDRNISSRCCHQIQHSIGLLVTLNHFRAQRFLSNPGLPSPAL